MRSFPITVFTVPLCVQIVLFAVPGAFTPTCSAKHVPGFLDKADELKAKGVDNIACVAVNDAFVMDAWGKSLGAEDKIQLLADGSAEFARVCCPSDLLTCGQMSCGPSAVTLCTHKAKIAVHTCQHANVLPHSSVRCLQALGVELDLSDKGLGVRSRRYAMLVDDGVVRILNSLSML